MANLETIKKRITSIDTTIKITFAMKMIAISKLQKFKKIYSTYEDYYAGIVNVFANILKNEDFEVKRANEIFYEFHKIDYKHPKTLYLIIGSDFGMCGPFNFALLKHLGNIFKKDDGIFLIGSKINSIIRSQHPEWNVVKTIYNIEKNTEPEYVFIVALEIFDFFVKNKYTELKIVYTRFINSLTFEPQTFQLIPIKLDEFINAENNKKQKNKFNLTKYEIDFNFERGVVSFIPQFFMHMFYAVLIESKVSEQSARYNAMNTATDNAEELKDQYVLEYNRTRQSSITQEIIEIINGSKKSHH